jgi:multiple sugar transport system substrate-binding protein
VRQQRLAVREPRLKPALPYTYSVFVHNMGGTYVKDGKSQMCSKEIKAATELYSKLLSDYGPPGVVNYSFYQITSLYKAGKAAISFGSSNEFGNIMEGGARLKDTAVTLLPPGPGGSHPTVIGWGVSISAFSGKKDAAWYFLQWSTSPEVQAKLALKGLAPPRASTATSATYKKWLDEEPLRRQWIDTINQAAKIGTSEIGYPIVANPQSREYMGQNVTDVFLGNKSLDEACAEATGNWTVSSPRISEAVRERGLAPLASSGERRAWTVSGPLRERGNDVSLWGWRCQRRT